MGRHFDAATAHAFELSFCEQAELDFRGAEGRLIAPIDFDGLRVGWQARLIRDPANRQIPKYLTCPGMPKSRLLYNFDRARRQPFIVVAEGITDVWRLGDIGVALLGKDISTQQVALLQQFSGRQRPVVVALDGDASDAGLRAAHAIHAAGVPTLLVTLPPGVDPADMPRDQLYAQIDQQARAVGGQLTWPTSLPPTFIS